MENPDGVKFCFYPEATRFFLIFNCLLTLTLNPLYLIVIRRVKNIPTSTKIFLASLAVSDFSMGLFVMLLRYIISYSCLEVEWDLLYIIRVILQLVFTMVCFFSLVLLTIDRYLAIARCLHYPRLVTTRRAKVAVCCGWLVAVALSLLSVTLSMLSFNIIFFSLYFIIFVPGLVIIVVLNVHVLVIARRHVTQRIKREKQFKAENRNTRRALRAHFKSFVNVFITVIFIFICWIPLMFRRFIGFNNYTAIMIFYCSNWANGLVFYLRNKSFRQVLHKMVSTNFRALIQKCRPRTLKRIATIEI